jgi:hypothetical protein
MGSFKRMVADGRLFWGKRKTPLFGDVRYHKQTFARALSFLSIELVDRSVPAVLSLESLLHFNTAYLEIMSLRGS